MRLNLPSPVTEVVDDRLPVRLFLKRDDLIHPDLPGNKWRKLKHNLAAARDQGHDTLLTFGGAYSNHLRATAAAGHHFGFKTIGLVRGEETLPLNPVLSFCVAHGMRLSYVDRAAYRLKEPPPGHYYLLPEGGSNELAVLGCAEIGPELDSAYEFYCVPAGTGGTLAGLAAGIRSGHAIGFSVLKGGDFLRDVVTGLQVGAYGQTRGSWSVETGFHFGGYAKGTPELADFVTGFHRRHGVRLDPVYTGKMLFGIYAMAAQGRFAPGSKILAVITG
jgi:1-aminocyclopropane-1-carboxylate deaminase